MTRARRAGLTVRMRRHRELSAEEMAAAIERADAWRDTETERGFSMALGRLGDGADGDCLLVEGHRGHRRGGDGRGNAVVRAVGLQRVVAGPDAPGAAVAQRGPLS